jgi:hypothetical protein
VAFSPLAIEMECPFLAERDYMASMFAVRRDKIVGGGFEQPQASLKG